MEFSQLLISSLPNLETLERNRGVQQFMRERQKLYKQLNKLQREQDKAIDNSEHPGCFGTDIAKMITVKQAEINELEAQIELVAEGV